MFLIQLFIFIFGLIVGSFLNVLISRLPREESIMGRSYCPKCKHILRWHELVPLFSFIFLGAKCHYCKEKISIQYPLVEIITGLLFVLIFNLSVIPAQAGIQIFYYLFITSCLMVIFVSDLKYFIIPDQVIYAGVIITAICSILLIPPFEKGGLGGILSALAASGFFLFLVLISRGAWMGMGDVKLAFLMGLILSWPNILIALFLSFFFGAIIGMALILFGKKGWKSEIPFGTFLTACTLIVLLLPVDKFFNLFY